jgi:hypothetical protein
MNTNLSTEAQRFDQIEKLRNEIRPTKSYQVTHAPQGKTFFDEANGGSVTINGHPIGVKYFYPATPHDMKQTENYARELENNLRAEHAIKHGTTHAPNLLDLIASTQINQALNELITREQNEGEADHETN